MAAQFWINSEGKRFFNEMSTRDKVSTAELNSRVNLVRFSTRPFTTEESSRCELLRRALVKKRRLSRGFG